MSTSLGKKLKHWDGASNLDTSSHGDSGDNVKNKKRKMDIFSVMYMDGSNVEGTPKRKKCKLNSENQDIVSDPTIPKRKKSGDGSIEKPTDQETYTKKKKRKYESRQNDAVSSMVLNQEYNKESKKAHKAKDTSRLHGDEFFTEEISCRENTDLEGRSKERKKKKTEKNGGERFLDKSLVENLSTVHAHHTHKKKTKRKDGDLQEDGFTEEVDENVDQSETAIKIKKRKEKSHQETDNIAGNGASPSIDLYLEENRKIQKSHKTKDPKRLHGDEKLIEETTYSKFTDSEGSSEKKMHKKPKKDHREQDSINRLVEESSTVDIQHTKKKQKRIGGGDLQEGGFTEEFSSQKKSSHSKETSELVDESVDQSETAAKKKKRKDKSHQGIDIAADDGASSFVLHREENEKITKSYKAKDTKRLYGNECFIEETQYSKLTDQEGGSEKKKKPKKDHKEKQLNNSLVEELSTVDIQHTKKKKKCRGGGDLQNYGFSDEPFSHRKSPDGKETSEQVDESLDPSETAVKKKKKKRKDEPHQETDDIAVTDGAIASIVLYQEKNEKIKKSYKGPGPKGCQGDEELPEEVLYKEPDYIKDKQSLDKKDHLIENSSVKELLRSETQHTKKKKKQKDDGGLQDDGFTEQFFSHSKSPDDSEAPEQVDECLEQVEKPIKKKKKKRRNESHQEAENSTVDDASSLFCLSGEEPSCSELNDPEDRPSWTKKEKVHLECPLKDSLLGELLNYDAQCTSKKKKTKQKEDGDESHRQHGFTESTEQVVKTVDQAEVHVKKAKNKKNLDRKEEASDILAEERQPEADQSLQSRAVQSDGNVEDTKQTSTSGQSRPTQDNRSTTSDKSTKQLFNGTTGLLHRKENIALIKEYNPRIREGTREMNVVLYQDLERIKMAKQKGMMFYTGRFTEEEDELIKKNVEKFMSNVGISSPVMLFHPYYFPDHLKTISLLRRKYQFAQRIAEGLYRFCNDVIHRGEKLYHFATQRGRFTEQEKKRLMRFHELHGDDYIAISELMSRTRLSTRNKILEMSHEVNNGPWSVEETNCLIAAVKEDVLDSLRKENNGSEEPVTVPKRKLYKRIKWEEIERKVGTRNWTHCKAHWSNIITQRMNNGFHPFKGDLGKLSSMKMIQWMHDAKVKDPRDIKWDKLCDDIGNVTAFSAQLNFIHLKETVSGFKDMRLSEIVDALYNVALPKLEFLVSVAAPPEPEKKEEFLISEMFREYTEYDQM